MGSTHRQLLVLALVFTCPVVAAYRTADARSDPPREVAVVDCVNRSDHILLVDELDPPVVYSTVPSEDSGSGDTPKGSNDEAPDTVPLHRSTYRLAVVEVLRGDPNLAGRTVDVVTWEVPQLGWPERQPYESYYGSVPVGEGRRLIFARRRADGLLEVAVHNCWVGPWCRDVIEGLMQRPPAAEASGSGPAGERVRCPRPPAPPPVEMVEGSAELGDIEGGTDEEERAAIRRTIRKYAGRTRQCYERELKSDPKLAGQVVVSIDIAAGTGNVNNAVVVSDTTGNDELARCIVRVVQRIPFSPAPEADVRGVRVPWVLAPR